MGLLGVTGIGASCLELFVGFRFESKHIFIGV